MKRPPGKRYGMCAVAVHSLAAFAAAQSATALERVATEFGFTVGESGLRSKVIAIPNATHAAIVAVVRVGAWHDPPGQTGLTHLLNTLVALTQENRPERERWSVRTIGPGTVIAITCARDAVAARLAELARFLAGELPFDADLIARARAQALKLADDFLNVVPGPLLFETARRQLLAGTPAGKQMFGVPEEMKAIGGAQLRTWFSARMRPEHTTLVVLGGVETAAAEGLCPRLFAAAGARTPPAELTVHDSAGPIALDRPHPRILAPFVTVAIKAPAVDSPLWLPFVIAMGVVQVRCQTTFGAYRGREAEALFPFFWFDYRHGDAFALINRRGASIGEGEMQRDVEAVRGELRALIKRLRTVAADLTEVRQAAFAAASNLMLPPYEGQLEFMAQNPGLLMPRAEMLAMADVLGLRATVQADVGHVPVVEVQNALGRALADDNLTWLSLVPK